MRFSPTERVMRRPGLFRRGCDGLPSEATGNWAAGRTIKSLKQETLQIRESFDLFAVGLLKRKMLRWGERGGEGDAGIFHSGECLPPPRMKNSNSTFLYYFRME